MSGRLRDGLHNLLGSISMCLRRPSGVKKRSRAAVIKGSMHRVIVVKPPNDIFREAVFIVNDDYFLSPGVSRKELLRQAKNAAADYIDEQLPCPDSPRIGPALTVFACGCALTVLLLYAAGLLS